MRYKSFRIRNFKGIKDTKVTLKSVAGASVFAFVGLNESGKTTVLEAIHSFKPDAATSELLGGAEQIGVPYKKRVPRHLISTFTGEIAVEARLEASKSDREAILAALLQAGIRLDESSFPHEFSFERSQEFKSGDFLQNYFTLRDIPQVKTGKQKNWRDPTKEERIKIRDVVYRFAPDIAYFPTFVFAFPSRIYLTNRGGKLDRFYRRVFQDILDYDGHGHTIEHDIVRRVRGEQLKVPWTSFWSAWSSHDDRPKIQHVIDRASAAVSKLVFGRWNRIFGEDAKGKEVLISYDVAEGEVEDDEGNPQKTNEHDVYVQFEIRDGTRRFPVNDRSLGFRWFFAFMLFTQFRVARTGSKALLFLFDEPAANLHAAAQQKLIDSFPEIAKGEHMLAYTTHSHYMIEPKWLEQTFIVTNRSDAPPTSLVDEISLDDESLDIQAAAYKDFVNKHPSQTSYFQPIIDRLEVVPSKFDFKEKSIIVEGKSDYYALRYAAALLRREDLPIVPALGAGTFDALIGLHLGWGLSYLFLLDSDEQGESERVRYSKEYGIPHERIIGIGDLAVGVSEIEKLLDAEALEAIKKALSLTHKPNKTQIARFFQEKLASNEVVELGSEFSDRSLKVISALDGKLKAL